LPFEPNWPGYTFRVRSKNFSSSLACFYENRTDKKGHVASLDDSQKIPDNWPCDGRSFTLNVAIDGELTLFFVLGGFPMIPDVTKKPVRVTEIKSSSPNCQSVCRRIEFEFDYKESIP
jgi:hypothetical protein